MTPAELTAVKTELANDHPVAIGMRWPKEPHLSSAHVQVRPPPAEVRDGHSIVVAGYLDDPGQSGGGMFIVRNSDGPGWGVEGYAYFPYSYMAEYGNDALALRHDPAAADAPRFQPAARFEAESLKIVKSSPRCQPSIQDMHDWGAKQWGGGKQLFCAAENGGSIELEFLMSEEGRFEMELYLTLAPDFGRLKILLDGRVLTRQPDCFCGRVEPTGAPVAGNPRFQEGVASVDRRGQRRKERLVDGSFIRDRRVRAVPAKVNRRFAREIRVAKKLPTRFRHLSVIRNSLALHSNDTQVSTLAARGHNSTPISRDPCHCFFSGAAT